MHLRETKYVSCKCFVHKLDIFVVKSFKRYMTLNSSAFLI